MNKYDPMLFKNKAGFIRMEISPLGETTITFAEGGVVNKLIVTHNEALQIGKTMAATARANIRRYGKK